MYLLVGIFKVLILLIIKICIAVVKENAESENAISEGSPSQNVGQTTFTLKVCTDLRK